MMKDKGMKKKIIIVLMTTFLSETPIFAASECIALTNYSDVAVEFDSLVSPGYSYTVQPKTSATLSGDHMAGACRGSNSCNVTVSSIDHTGYSIIKDLPRGTHIVYGGPNQYYLDKNAHAPCK